MFEGTEKRCGWCRLSKNDAMSAKPGSKLGGWAVPKAAPPNTTTWVDKQKQKDATANTTQKQQHSPTGNALPVRKTLPTAVPATKVPPVITEAEAELAVKEQKAKTVTEQISTMQK